MQNQIPKNWQKVKLGEIAKIGTGSTNTQDAVVGGKYPLFDRSLEIKRSNKYLFDREAVIIPGEGKEFIPRFFSGKFDLHQRVYAIYSLQNEVLNKFLFYWFCLNNKYLSKYAVGSTVKSLRLPIFENLSVLLPPQTTQHRIISILSGFDDKIEVNNKIAKTLEDMAQALFKEWFVHFRFPRYEKAEFVDSELGKIPKGWEAKKIKDIAKINKGLSYSSNEINEKSKGLPMINLANFQRGGGFNPDGIKFYTGRYNSTNLVKPGGIVIAMTDLTSNREVIGHPARVPSYSHWDKILISLDVCAVATDELYVEFLYYLMLRKEFSYRMASSAGGTNVAHLSKSTIEDYNFVLPVNDLIEKFQNFVRPIFSQTNLIEVENQKLAALRDLLLPKLMRGEIRV